MLIELKMDQQTAKRMWEALSDLFTKDPSPSEEAIIKLEIWSNGRFDLNCDRPWYSKPWR